MNKSSAILPKVIQCKVSKDGIPCAGVLVKAIFKTNYKNPYSDIFGPTDHHGHAELRRATILLNAKKQLDLALMDYGPLENGFAGTIEFSLMTSEAIERAKDAYELFGKAGGYSSDYGEQLEQALKVTKTTDPSKLLLEVSTTPPDKNLILKVLPPRSEPDHKNC